MKELVEGVPIRVASGLALSDSWTLDLTRKDLPPRSISSSIGF